MRFVIYSEEPFLKRIIKRFRACDIQTMSNGMVYATLIAIIPCLAIAWFVFERAGMLDRLLVVISDFLNNTFGKEMGESLNSYINMFTKNAVELGATGFVSFIITFLILIDRVWNSMNRIFEGNKSSLPGRFFKYILFLIICSVLLFVYALIKSRFSSWFRFLSKLPQITGTQSFIENAVPYIVVLIAVFCLYYILPSYEIRFVFSAAGSVVCTFLICLLSALFKFVVRYFVRYSVIYGSLAAILFFLMYLSYCWQIVFLCALFVRTLNDVHKVCVY